jgi:hypothetical protein
MSRVGDAVVARAYLTAEYRLYRVTVADLPASRRSVATYVDSIAAQCPNALAGAPHNIQFDELLEEGLFAISVIASRPDRHALLTFVREIRPLHRIGQKLGRLFEEYARSVLRETKATVPDLCADYAAWVRSDYRTVTESTKHFVEEMEAKEPVVKGANGSEPVQNAIDRLLARYENSSMKRLIKLMKPLENSFESIGTEIVFGASVALSKALGVHSASADSRITQ